MSISTCVASLTHQFSFCSTPEIPGEKRTKTGRVGGWGAGGWAIRLVAALLSMFFSRMQALSQGLWVLCVEMGVDWCIVGAGEVSDP